MDAQDAELIDDGTKRDGRGRRLMSPERVAQLLREYDQSGLTQAGFARRAGVKYPTFAGWVRARRLGSGPGTEQPVQFTEVRLPLPGRPDQELSVALPDGLVVRGAEASAVAALVRALRS